MKFSTKEVLSVISLTRKIFVMGVLGLVLASSNIALAGVNPFKKSKNYSFSDDVPWYENSGAALKSGSVRDGADTNYYHLNINKDRLLLRLSKNDPSGELIGTRTLEVLAITDVLLDGRQLPIFGWCLKNQQSPGKKLKQNAVVANDTCVNAGGMGDFVINLDGKTLAQLRRAQMLEFLIEPYGRPVKLAFSMKGYSPLMAKINKPVVVKKAPVVKAKPKPPKPKPVVKAKPKPVKMCNARPPAEFKKQVKFVPYPCKDANKKVAAEKRVALNVQAERKKQEAKIKAAKLKDAKRKEEKKPEPVEDKKREAEWDNKQAALWISRCERHWKKGKSPCYCSKYLDQAPEGVKNTCKK